MIVSHRFRFIFIKTAKTAGTSIEVYLSQHCGEEDIVTPIIPHVEPHRARNYRGVWNPWPEIACNGGRGGLQAIKSLLGRQKFSSHIPAQTLQHRLPGRVWKDYFKFCVERNPWDKSLSHYWMLRERGGGTLGFDQYLADGAFCLNYPRYTDPSGRVLVDKVLRYENLVEELTGTLSSLGVPFDGSLGIRAKSEFRKDRRPYRDVLTGAQSELIARAFSKEIALHGYTF